MGWLVLSSEDLTPPPFPLLMKLPSAFLLLLAASALAQETKPTAAEASKPATADAAKPTQVEVLDLEGKRFVLVKNITSPEEFAGFDRNVQVMNQQLESAKLSKQLVELALTTPEREARQRELEAKEAKLNADNENMAKTYGYSILRQYVIVQTKLTVLTALTTEEYAKLSAAKDFKAESVVNGAEGKKLQVRETVKGAVEVEAFKLQVQRVMEARKALQQLVELQPRLTKDEDKKKVEEAVRNAQGEVNKALEDFRKARQYDLPNEITVQTAEAKLYTLLSDDEKKNLQEKSEPKKDAPATDKK